jgi:hypothetical protein
MNLSFKRQILMSSKPSGVDWTRFDHKPGHFIVSNLFGYLYTQSLHRPIHNRLLSEHAEQARPIGAVGALTIRGLGGNQ